MVLYSEGVVTEGASQQGREVGGMSPRAAAWLAWPLWLLVVAYILASVDLNELRGDWYTLSHPRLTSPEDIGGTLIYGVLGPGLMLAYATVGAIVVSLRPRNGVGWLCLAVGLMVVLVDILLWLAASMHIAFLESWLSSVTWVFIAIVLLIVTLMLLIFPDGCLPSRRWRFAVWTALMGFCIVVIADSLPSFRAGVEAAQTVGLLTSLVAFIASMVAVIFRWRRSGGQERQQLKWLVYVGAVTIAAALGGVTSLYVQDDIAGAWSYSTVFGLVVALAGVMVGVPFAMGVAILKHRLYDIDRLINRTLVYATLTASLTLVYVGSILLLAGIGSLVFQVPFRALTGQKSTLAVVVSTLAIAAIFNPLRRRIQSLVDRRFYRRKYDAAKILASFNARLRDETNLDALNDELAGVVRETMQPVHVSLWLRPSTDAHERGKEPSG